MTCQNDSATPHISFFRVPPDCSDAWLTVINRGELWRPAKSTKICSAHFPASCIRGSDKRRYLSVDAVPLLHPIHAHTDEIDVDANDIDALAVVKAEYQEPLVKLEEVDSECINRTDIENKLLDDGKIKEEPTDSIEGVHSGILHYWTSDKLCVQDEDDGWQNEIDPLSGDSDLKRNQPSHDTLLVTHHLEGDERCAEKKRTNHEH